MGRAGWQYTLVCGLLSLMVWESKSSEAQSRDGAGQTPAASSQTVLQKGQKTQSLSATPLGEVVVTATRIEEPVSQASQAVTVITQDEIEQRQVTDVSEELRAVPGFTIVQSGSRGGTTSLFVRGGETDHNLVLVDGVKANLGGGAFDFSDLTTLGIERIEVVRGPQSALYGSDAISSVIQLFTPRGTGPPHGFLRFRGGNHDTFEEHVGISGGTQRYGYFLSIARIDTEGHLSVNNDYSNTTVASRFDLDPMSNLQLTSTVRYIDSRFHFPTESAGDRFDPPDPRQYQDRRRLILGPRIVYRPTAWWQHRLQLGLFHEWRTFRDPFDEDVIDPFGAFVSNAREHRLSADYSSDFFLPPIWYVIPTFTLGAYVEDEHLNQKSNSDGVVERVSPSRNAQSFYSQLLLAWQERLFVTSGFRLDDGSTYGTHLNPRFSAAYIVPRIQTKLRGGYGEGLKAPTFVENFGIGSEFISGNRNLEPEESEGWEVGINQPLVLANLAAELSLTYFSTEYKNLIAFVFREGPDFLNVQRARSRGLEVGLQTFLNETFSVRGAYTYLDTKVLDAGESGGTAFVNGEPLLRRPAHTGSFTLNYARDRVQANMNLTIKGHAADLDFSGFPDEPERRARLSGYTKADLAVAYRLLEDRWGLRAVILEGVVRNIFDLDYEEVFGFSAPGAHFLVGFRAEF